MQGLETAVLRLATTVTSMLVKSLLAPRPGAGLAEKPVPPGGPLRRPRRLTDKETQRLVDTLADRLSGAGTSVPEHERLAAVAAAADAFRAAGPLAADRLLAVDLDPERLRREVLARALGVPDRAGLGADATALFDRLLDLCCAHVVEYLTTLPEFPARGQVELVRRTGTMVEALADIRHRLGPGPERTAAAYEARYSDFVRATQSRLQLFGVTLSGASAEWALDTAYISLGVRDEAPADPGFGEFGPGSVRIEHALAATSRLLLRGPAGSGKSTLVQWLATNAARRSFGPELADWNICVPFVLRLRALTERETLPLPVEFLSSMGNPLSGAAPAGWVEGLMSSGRALVLVDGVDEVPQRLRRRTEEWLRQLVTAFPDARYVVTTRPSAVPENWLTPHGFRAHALLPMSREDVRSFITHWHDAAREETGEPLEAYQDAMLQAVTARRELSRLTTNPLMCALLCALNRDRRMQLPRARKDLYDAALEMLLIRRDTEREICAVEGVELTRDEQTLLLQELAYWLIRNGQLEADRADAVERIQGALAAMPQVRAQGDAEQVFRHLLIRSGLLREPAPGAVVFVHRTFQDYLAAKAAVEAGDFGLLAERAHDDQWEDVVRMAVGHARPDERARLLRRILKRADRVKKWRNRLNLLAAACLEHAPQLDPGVREEVERRTNGLVPPRDFPEAEELSAAGELVLDLLPPPEGLDEWTAAAVVHTAARIGGPAAQALIARFRHETQGPVRVQIHHGWRRFETEEYVDAVLADAPENKIYLPVETEEQLRCLPRLPQYRAIGVEGELPLFDYVDPKVELLQVLRNPSLGDLSPLARFGSLRVLYLGRGVEPGLDLSVLRDLPSLTDLSLPVPSGPSGLESVPAGPALVILGLHAPDDGLSLHGITRWPRLRRLQIAGAVHPGELEKLATLAELETLSVSQRADLRLAELAPLQRITRLFLFGCDVPEGLAPLAELPGLTELGLVECTQSGAPVDLAPLQDLSDLVITLREDSVVLNEHLIPPERVQRPELRRFFKL
ncbi:NACHT domain-containing protein [Streptomyces sp. NPDC018031]|uniref:NACHT domain-containing protein n=1 Tax=Streptomyces sp. NPDC018031 TaxID=3365033 RepID=UPI0037AABAA4